MNPKKKPNDFQLQAICLTKVIKRILEIKGDIYLSKKPTIKLKPISEFMERMRVTSLGKFDRTTYISTINFYTSKKELKEEHPIGALIIYLEEGYIDTLMEKLEYPNVDIDDPAALRDACGTFCNLVAGKFKSALLQLGFEEIVMSHFSSFKNKVDDGVPFYLKQKKLYEIDFEVNGEKRIVAELTLGPLPKHFPEL